MRRLCLTACAVVAATLMIGGLLGCSSGPETMVVSAASDLTFAFEAVGRQFHRETGTRVVFNFGSTGQLARQIKAGAPVDVFAAADVSYIDDLEREKLVVDGSKSVYAIGWIVLWHRSGSPLQIADLKDLLRPEVRRVAIANPEHAPYGVAARRALQSAGVWEAVQPKLVLAENVRQALQYAETGNVDVAIVALSLAVQSGGRWDYVAPELYPPIEQALALVKGAKHEAEARRFIAFLLGPSGQEIMGRYGFAMPGEGAP